MPILDTVNFLQELSQQDRMTLENFCQIKSLEKGEELFHEGDDANAVYLLVSGRLSVYRLFGDYQEYITSLIPEDMVGEMAVF